MIHFPGDTNKCYSSRLIVSFLQLIFIAFEFLLFIVLSIYGEKMKYSLQVINGQLSP